MIENEDIDDKVKSWEDVIPNADMVGNRDTVTIKMASQMPSEELLAYYGITIMAQTLGFRHLDS
jgi:hypothetical protein